MDSFNETEFRARVDAALARIRTVLENTRNPRYAADVPHTYDDKFHLAEFLTRASIAALVQCLTAVGLTPESTTKLCAWARARAVTLRLKSVERCRFVREESRKVESASQYVTESTGFFGGKSTKTEKVVTTVTEYFWCFEFETELFAFQGNDPDDAVVLLSRRGKIEIKTAAKVTPRPETVVRPARDVNITWLLQHIDAAGRAAFSIDRTGASCHTPRRNPEIDAALRAHEELATWCAAVRSYVLDELFTAQQDHGLDLGAIDDSEVFVPVVPLFESAPRAGQPLQRLEGEGDGDGAGDDHPLLPAAHLDAFLDEQQRSLASKCRDLARVFPRDGAGVITAVEASLLVVLMHARQVCASYALGVSYVEQLLYRQLVAAIGKEVTPQAFSEYMDFHYRKLVKPAYRPLPFSHAIRRAAHDPEGVLSLEVDRGGAMADPVYTTVAVRAATRPMRFALDASTRVSFMGERLLHAWVSHQFSGTAPPPLSLVARARQFSSFVLLIGRIASADTFEPRYGILVQNKDLLKIPLMLETIPTPKEFRDAIESLSPEQQRFAKAFRSMQLESTLFGVCVIHVKPQLEKLLKLDPDSLTKEIKLTQELASLFIEYQIPSDLLSYDGPAEASAQDKLAKVKEYVGRMQEMIGLSKQREIDEAREREALRLAELNRTHAPVPPPAPPGPFESGSMSVAAPTGMLGGSPAFAAAPGRAGPPMPSAPRAMSAPSSTVTASAPMPAPAPAPAPVPKSAPAPVTPAAQGKATASPAPTRTAPSSPQGLAGEHADAIDYTRIPAELDAKFLQLDDDRALRPTILNAGDTWSRTSQKGLLASPVTASLGAREQKSEKNKAFDLLDALTKSGALSVEDASLHVVIAATHRFDRTLTDTVIQNNVNPIEKVERSLMIVATTIHGRPATELLADEQRERFLSYAPRLGPASSAARQLATTPDAGEDPSPAA